MPPDPGYEADVAILGAGPVGCILALALRDCGLRVVLVGRRADAIDNSKAPRALRPLALSYASRLILERAGAWSTLQTSPIEAIHVSQSGAFGRTRMNGSDLGLPALGYVVDYGRLAASISDASGECPHWQGSEPQPRARLLVHAEGSIDEHGIEKDYGQTAIVAAIECEPSAGRTAWERFTAEGPLALLPLGKHYGTVWSVSRTRANELLAMDEAQFLSALQAAFGRRAGRFTMAGPRAATPLRLRYRGAPAKPGEVYIGNAAQTLHPVAGQGLNLGLRDAWDLAQAIRSSPLEALGTSEFTARFARARRLDSRATRAATHLLATLYTRSDPLSSFARGAALAALDVLPPVRNAFARRMVYGASAW